MNRYQRTKARKIADCLLKASAQSSVRATELPRLVSLMSDRDWQTLCFAAGVPIADLTAKRFVLAELRGKSLTVVR